LQTWVTLLKIFDADSIPRFRDASRTASWPCTGGLRADFDRPHSVSKRQARKPVADVVPIAA
jgi:hypothetical protein